MKAIILVGGEATRLRPLTCNTPKAMVPVLNKPFLEHVIHHLSQHQVKEIVLTLSHRQQSIKRYFGNGSQFGVRLNYAVEDTPLGTAGAVKNAEKYLDETFLMLNGDIFTDLDITAMMKLHRDREAKITIARTPVEDPVSYGLIEADTQGRITRFIEKPSPNEIPTNLINAGIYILEPDILTHIPPRVNFSIEHGLFVTLPNPAISAWVYDYFSYWMDMGTPEKYLQLHRDLLDGKSSRYSPPSKSLIGKQSHIHPTTQIKGAVVIGDNCNIESNVMLTGPIVIGSGCIIQPGAIIEDSIIWHKVEIGQRAVVKNSIIANNCHLYPDCCVTDGSLLSDNVIVNSGCQLKPASKIWPGTRVEADT